MVFPCNGAIDILAHSREHHRYMGSLAKGTQYIYWCSLAREHHISTGVPAREHQYIYGVPLQGNTIDMVFPCMSQYIYGVPCKRTPVDLLVFPLHENHRYTGVPCKGPVYLWCSLARASISMVFPCKGTPYIYGVPLQGNTIDIWVPLQGNTIDILVSLWNTIVYLVFPCKGTP